MSRDFARLDVSRERGQRFSSKVGERAATFIFGVEFWDRFWTVAMRVFSEKRRGLDGR